MVHDAPVDALAARIAEDWGQLPHTAVAAMIADLYADLIVVPPSWPTHRRHTLLTETADTTATELSALLDDYLDRDAAAPHTTEHGWSAHPEDRHHATTTALAALTEDHLTRWITDLIPALIADDVFDEDSGRSEVSMTACSAAHRPPTLMVRRSPRCGRQHP